MGVKESIEYYSACPQCGAANKGNGVCEYCGGSLIKRRINEKTEFPGASEEEANLMEDYNLSEVNGKLRERDMFLLIFCLVFGGSFTLVPVIIGVAFTSAGIMEGWVILMLAVFLLVGICSFIPLIRSAVHAAKCKMGEPVSGIVRGYENSLSSINGQPVLNIRLLVDKDTNPYILVMGTGKTKRQFKPGTVIYLKRYKNSYIYDKDKMNMK